MRAVIVDRHAVIGCLLLLLPAVCLGDTAGDLEQAKTNVISLIRSGDIAGASVAIDSVIAGIPDGELKRQAIVDIAGVFKEAKEYGKTIELCRYVLAQWPKTNQAMWSQMHIAWSYAVMGQLSAAEAETETLIAQYADNPDLPWAIHVMAEVHLWGMNYARAEELYELIVKQHPDSPWAQKARFGLAKAEVLSLIQARDFEKAGRMLERMRTDFATEAGMPEILRAIADNYKWAEQYEEAERLYQELARQSIGDANKPKLDIAVRKVKIMALIESGRNGEAQEAITALTTDFAGQGDVAETVYWFGRRHEWSGRYDLAAGVYQQLVALYPENGFARMARLDLAKGKILTVLQSGENRRILRAVDRLITDYPQDSYLRVIAAVLEQRRQVVAASEAEATYLAKMVEAWEQVLDANPSSSMFAAWGYHLAGECCRSGLNDQGRAARNYEKVVGQWPQYRYAGDAMSAAAGCYEAMKQTGALSQAEADAKIEQAYTIIAEKYPDCASARRAFSEVGWYGFKRGDWAKAAENFEKALQLYPKGRRPAQILYPLGRAYEETGQIDKAAKVYKEFIDSVSTEDPRAEKVKGRLQEMSGQDGSN